ncbi:MAG: hypothetical protein PHF79_01775 [Candidatus Pacebacteria bacterium]|nr:hypothetical protein [Candidatus Paceibacterota bacterium]
MLRKDFGPIQIDLNKFERFVRGCQISQHVEGELSFKNGDFVEWEAPGYHGHANIILGLTPRNGWTYVTLSRRTMFATDEKPELALKKS